MVFPDVVGQQTLVDQLVGMVEHNRLSHAIILAGRPGTGVLPLAVNFGQYVVSQEASATAQSHELFGASNLFGEAVPIEQPFVEPGINALAAKLMHPDLHFTYPVIPRKTGDKPISTDFIAEWRDFYKQLPYGSEVEWIQSIGAENQQGNITAAECEDILRKLLLKPFSSRYKVLVIWLPEYLGKNGNKLLKLIEEPAPDTLLILATHQPDLILPTILSRCQYLKVPPIATNDLEAALINRQQLEPKRARQLALTADGSYGEALEALHHTDEDLNEVLREWLNAALLKGSKANERFGIQIKVVTQLAAMGREKQKQLLRYLIQLIEQSIRLRLMGEAHLHMPEAELTFAARLNTIAGIGQQKAIAEEMDKATYYLERNANAKILFHALTLKLRGIVQDKTIFLAQ